MSLISEIERLRKNVNNTLDSIERKGVEIPEGSKSDNLPELVEKIPSQLALEMEDDGNGNLTLNSTVFTSYDDGDGNISFIPTAMLIESEDDGNIVLA